MNSRKDFVLLITNSADNDAIAERTANAGRSVIHHKLCYVPIYKDFDEIRNIQLKLKGHIPFSNKKLCAIIDISEWVGHENDEYFEITLKYLHDMCCRMRYVFTVGKADEKEVLPLFLKLRCYLDGVIENDRTLTDIRKLSSYLVSQCIEEKSAGILSQMIMRDELEQLRTIPIINSICRDLRLLSKSGKATAEDISVYLSDPCSLPALVSANTAKEYAKLFGGMQINKTSENREKRSA